MLKRIARLYKSLNDRRRVSGDPINYARSLGVRVGDGCRFIGVTIETFGTEPYLIQIGNHVTLTANVRFINHDGGVWVLRDKCPDADIIAPIVIGDNTFIGMSTLIMPGVTIGDNCVIGAGSVVTRDIPSGHVAVGVPARCIKTIAEYEEKVRQQALHIRSLGQSEKREKLEQTFFP